MRLPFPSGDITSSEALLPPKDDFPISAEISAFAGLLVTIFTTPPMKVPPKRAGIYPRYTSIRSTFFTGMVEISTAASPPKLVRIPSTNTPTWAAVEPRTVTTVYCPLPFTSRTWTPGTIFRKSARSFCSPLNSSGRMTVTVPGDSLDSQSGRFASTVTPAIRKAISSSAGAAGISAARTASQEAGILTAIMTAIPKKCRFFSLFIINSSL